MSSTPPSSPATLLVNGFVHSPADPFATALLVVDDTVAWVGSDAAATTSAPSGARVVDLDGALVTAAFVDAHVHTTAVGLRLVGAVLDLSHVRSARELLDAVRGAASGAPLLLGEGWDETRWDDPRLPTAGELDEAAGGAQVLLGRVDAHASLAGTALLRAPGQAAAGTTGHLTGHLTGTAHTAATSWAYAHLPAELRTLAQRAALRHAASLGIGAVHEMGGPGFGGPEDLRALLSLTSEDELALPRVTGYWGELGASARALELGAAGAAGDVLADGTLGSRTAALREPYADRAGWSGEPYVSAAQVRDAVLAAAADGSQAGFHVIGDGALDVVVAGLREAAERVGASVVRAGRHRLEHLEMPDAGAVAVLADLGVVASVQPAFDAAWGGADGMYAARLGAERAARLNPFGALAAAGVVLAFGSDAPVTPLAPWEAVRAASQPRTPGAGLSVRAAFAAHTRGGWRAIGRDDAGVLVPGAPATYAVWEPGELVVAAPDSRVAAWSTDPRSGIPGLPDLSPGVPAPRCLRTVVDGRTAYEAS
ncbi:hypothetical protein CLV35_3806 [Motilibacter peucedani]|uniref:Amidohydrolase 3 domain-containing protein n=1 Tax=Motilibacter peucedani TaxID=598650 RepID=A0A420XJK1_9ACTN|nr:amidohydrolase family protein [Motilibacter peucedani]RKS67902.1 hypothetical protein CLV35_3806 [Motilibacter peucedani]